MDSFIFAINATIPIFLVILLGWYLRRIGMLTKPFTDVADKYVFKVALPLLLFYDIASSDLSQDFQWSFVLFCALGTIAMFLATWLIAKLFIRDKSMVGAFAQGAARSSAAILGVAFVQNIYGEPGQLPLMIVAAVPLFNILSVVILTFSATPQEPAAVASQTFAAQQTPLAAQQTPATNQTPVAGREGLRPILIQAAVNIIRNPIILGILAGLPFALLQVNLPAIAVKTITSVGNTATPIALLSIGATFDGSKALAKIKPTVWATVIKLVILPAIYLPAAIAMGFTHSQLIAILIMTGSPTTVSCYIMAKNMDNDHVLTSSVIVVSTLLSAVTLTFWIFLLRYIGLI